MQIVDRGSGVPIVVIPGVQGRWEWMEPFVRALAARARVIVFSLADEPTAEAAFDPADGIGNYVTQVRDAMDTARIERATVCGTSFGGLVAAVFGATYPERVAGLALVSALPPSWTPNSRQRLYLRAPRLLLPLFCLNSLRLWREIAAAYGSTAAAIVPALRHLVNVLAHPFSPRLMARRAEMVCDRDLTPDVAGLRAPVLVITGEGTLDHVVPPRMTARYLELWPHAEWSELARTGHIGHVTRPEALANMVAEFASRVVGTALSRKHIGRKEHH